MQTRHKARQQTTADAAALLPHLPTAVQTLILDQLVAFFPEPDPEEYAVLRPHRTSLCWLLSLRMVCGAWDQHLQQQTTLARRIRLERLRNLSHCHFYAYYITCADESKQWRIKQVPRSLRLRFSDGSSTIFDVPRGGIAGAVKQYGQQQTEQTDGLPKNALVIVTNSQKISCSALLELLTDMDALDKQHAAPLLLQIQRHNDSSRHCNTSSRQHRSRGRGDCAAAKAEQSAVGVVEIDSFAALEAAVLPALSARGPLRDIVKEGGASSAALTFIPTKNSFCRRLPADP